MPAPSSRSRTRTSRRGTSRCGRGLPGGDGLTPESIDRAQQSLLQTGLFYSAILTPRNPEVPEGEKTVLVTLRERPTRGFQASAGFSLADGPRVSAQWTQGNVFG